MEDELSESDIKIIRDLVYNKLWSLEKIAKLYNTTVNKIKEVV